MEIEKAKKIIREMGERWDETECWHEPPFHAGKIQITTRQLHAASILMKHLDEEKEKAGTDGMRDPQRWPENPDYDGEVAW